MYYIAENGKQVEVAYAVDRPIVIICEKEKTHLPDHVSYDVACAVAESMYPMDADKTLELAVTLGYNVGAIEKEFYDLRVFSLC